MLWYSGSFSFKRLRNSSLSIHPVISTLCDWRVSLSLCADQSSGFLPFQRLEFFLRTLEHTVIVVLRHEVEFLYQAVLPNFFRSAEVRKFHETRFEKRILIEISLRVGGILEFEFDPVLQNGTKRKRNGEKIWKKINHFLKKKIFIFFYSFLLLCSFLFI